MTYEVLDVSQWARAQHLKFYQGFSHPWYNICSNIDVTALHQYCKQHNHRFFHAYLYLTQQALNKCGTDELSPCRGRSTYLLAYVCQCRAARR
ncbi:CatA-like O-acetyltransferase [Aliivibrio wodanis]|uniref:CatA-like O-acetyltransferase n=1 Tax=Aliivibrio wodanis TaxID=80852 RepID=UPI00406CF624